MPSCVKRGKRLHGRLRPANSSMAVLIPFTYDSLRRCLEGNVAGERIRYPPLVLDCRSPSAYAEGHIIGSVNVHCPSGLREMSNGVLPLWTLIADPSVRERLTNGTWSSVVLYEHRGLSSVEDSAAPFVARCLQAESAAEHIYLLEGGFYRFRRHCPHLCVFAMSQEDSNSQNAVSSAALSSPSQSPNPASSATPRSLRRCSSCSSEVATPATFCFEQEAPVEILPHLYLGSAGHASNKDLLQRLGITALLNVSHTCPNHFEDSFIYKSIPIEDSGNEDISIWFCEAIEYIDQAKENCGKVLVHCEAGISRSATICVAYVMVYKHLRMDEAYKYIKSRRKIISPNFSFMDQLLRLEGQIFSSEKASSCKAAEIATSPTGQCPASPGSPLLAAAADSPLSRKASSPPDATGQHDLTFQKTTTNSVEHKKTQNDHKDKVTSLSEKE